MTDREIMQQALCALAESKPIDPQDNAAFVRSTKAIEALIKAFAQPEQEPIVTEKNGSPCPEFWDWLPKAYNFEGNGTFTKYNMEVAFLAGKNMALAQPEQSPKLFDADADTNIVRGLEPKGKGWVTLNQHNPEHQPWCDYLNIVLTSMPPQRANCNCKTAQREPKSISTNDHLCAMLRQVHDVLACTALPMKRQWVGLTVDEILDFYEDHLDRTMFLHIVKSIEVKLKEKNNAF